MAFKMAFGLAATGLAGFATFAQAANNVRYVSTRGANANPCTLAKPCRTLQRGINATPAGAELRVLDSGFYGANANVHKSITISGNGNTVLLDSPIVILKAAATVTLRGLTLNGSTNIGIQAFIAAAVHIERCVVHCFTMHGITSGGNIDRLTVTDSVVRDNGMRGLYVFQTSQVSIERSRFENNDDAGLYIQSSSHASVSRSLVTGNRGHGVVVNGGRVTATHTTAAHNASAGYTVLNGGQLALVSSVVQSHRNGSPQGIGLVMQSGSTAVISNSTFSDNINGVVVNSGTTVFTRGNNTFFGNISNVIGSLTPLGGV
jgi:hypothetical protein